jgi:hypothetical protein
MSALGSAWWDWASNNPTSPAPAGSSWSGKCALAQSRFGNSLGWTAGPSRFGPGAIDVGNASGWLNTDPSTAPIGAWHFFAIGRYGHVGRDLDGGGVTVGMAGTAHLSTEIHPYIGLQSVQGYVNASGATYAGWATNYAGGTTNLPAEAVPVPAVGPTQRVVGSGGIKQRPHPETVDAGLSVTPKDAVLSLVGFVHGESVNGNDVWFVGADGDYYWSGGTTDPTTHDLPDLTPAPPVVVVVPPVVVPDPIIVVPPVVVIPDPPVVVVPPVVIPDPIVVAPPVVTPDPIVVVVPPVVVIPDPPVVVTPPAVVVPPVVVPKPVVAKPATSGLLGALLALVAVIAAVVGGWITNWGH